MNSSSLLAEPLPANRGKTLVVFLRQYAMPPRKRAACLIKTPRVHFQATKVFTLSRAPTADGSEPRPAREAEVYFISPSACDGQSHPLPIETDLYFPSFQHNSPNSANYDKSACQPENR